MMNYYKQPITNSVCEKNANQSRDWQCGIPLPSAFSSFCLSSVIKVKFGWIRSLIPWITLQSDLREGKQPVSVFLCVFVCVCVYESMLLFFLFYFVISVFFFKYMYVCPQVCVCVKMADPETPTQPLIGAPSHEPTVNVGAPGQK